MAEQELGFLEDSAGEGLDTLARGNSTPMLLIAQPLSQTVTEGTVKVGHFYASSTGEDLGDSVSVCVHKFGIVWNIWTQDQKFKGRVLPESVATKGDKFKGTLTTIDGDKIQEIYVYLVSIKGRDDLGYLVLNATPGMQKYFRSWNNLIFGTRLPSGKPCPIYGHYWLLRLKKTVNGKNQPFYAPVENGKSTIIDDGTIDKTYFDTIVTQARDMQLQLGTNGDEQQNTLPAPNEDVSF